MDKYNVMNARW